MSRIIIQDGNIQGSNRIIIMKDSGNQESSRRLKLMIGSNQIVYAAVGTMTFKSEDFGDTYSSLPTDFPVLGVDTASFSTNNIFYAVGETSVYGTNPVYGFSFLAISDDSGQTWNGPKGLRDISINFTPAQQSPGKFVWGSKDGKYIVASAGAYYAAGDVIVSNNFGKDPSIKLTLKHCYNGVVDDSGQNMLIGGHESAHYSNNYGYTWSNFTGFTTLGGAVISGDGNYKVACEYTAARIAVGTNWSSWTTTTLPTTYINAPSISYDGKYILVVSSNKYQGNDTKIFVSNNYGASFTTVTMPTNQSWRFSAMSLDGKYMIAGGGHPNTGYGKTYKSIDYGVTWELIPEMSDLGIWNHASMSKSGKYVYVSNARVDTHGGIYHSKDYMATWTQQFDGSAGVSTVINF